MKLIPRIIPLYSHHISNFRVNDFVALNPQFEMVRGRDSRITDMKNCRLMISKVSELKGHGYVDIVCRGVAKSSSWNESAAAALQHSACPLSPSGFIRVFDTDLTTTTAGQAPSVIGSLLLKMYIDLCHACGDRTNRNVIKSTDGHHICRECLHTDRFYPPYKVKLHGSDCCRTHGCGVSEKIVYSASADEVLANIFGRTSNAVR